MSGSWPDDCVHVGCTIHPPLDPWPFVAAALVLLALALLFAFLNMRK